MYLQWESASNKGLKKLQVKKLNCKQKSSNCWKATKECQNQRGTKIRVFSSVFSGPFPPTLFQQTRVYPYPLVAGSARPNPKMGAPDPENPLFLGFSVLRGGPRPWSETMVSEGARPWGGGRSGDCDFFPHFPPSFPSPTTSPPFTSPLSPLF